MFEFTDNDLMELPTGSIFVFDLEIYINLFVIRFKHLDSLRVVTFEENIAEGYNRDKLAWMLWNFKIIGFNSKSFDIPLITLALSGLQMEELKTVCNRIILGNLSYWDIEKEFNIHYPEVNTIDLIEVCPLQGSLKLYGARLHCRTIQDLPYEPETVLTYEQAQNVKAYLNNDLEVTELVYNELKGQIKVRENMSERYGIDLRSKSDAQIAEAVISSEIYKIKKDKIQKPIIKEGDSFYYNIPSFVCFNDLKLQNVLETVRTLPFIVDKTGYLILPKAINDLKLNIGNSVYKMGLGGLHSTEKTIAHYSDDEFILKDVDVESFYPRIILILGLFPKQLGPEFLTIFESIVNERIEAKHLKIEITADGLKITINGSFGKFGSKWSILYAPDLLLQVTLTGQLVLLMLIKYIESVGISVVSANTDGIVIKCPRNREEELSNIIKSWENHTGFKTEETKYKALLSRDVNNYIAVKENGTCKTKGEYSNPWSDKKLAIFRFYKNPQTTICIEAITELLSNGTPIEETINNCKDIKKFVSVKNVRGGGVYKGGYLGKVVRWYYATGETD